MALLKNLLKKLKLNESLISTVLGVLVVVVIGSLVINYFRNVKKVQAPGSDVSTVSESAGEEVKMELPGKYLVKTGDNLWNIAQNLIGSGYNWVDIAKENQLDNPEHLIAGQELLIPKVEIRKPILVAEKETMAGNAITEDSYMVVKGDNLWQISLRAYGDGYQWVKIARENNLVHPNLIHPGNVLKLSR